MSDFEIRKETWLEWVIAYANYIPTYIRILLQDILYYPFTLYLHKWKGVPYPDLSFNMRMCWTTFHGCPYLRPDWPEPPRLPLPAIVTTADVAMASLRAQALRAYMQAEKAEELHG